MIPDFNYYYQQSKTHFPSPNLSNFGKYDWSGQGFLIPLLDHDPEAPCLVFNCDFYDGSVGAWVSTDIDTPCARQIHAVMRDRELNNLTAKTLAGVIVYRCNSIAEAITVGRYLDAPVGSSREAQCFKEILSCGISITTVVLDDDSSRYLCNALRGNRSSRRRRKRRRG